MTRPTDFGAQCEHGRLARKCERCADADEIASLRDCAKQYEQWLAQDQATIADLRDQNERMRRLLDYVQQTAPGVLVAAHVNAGKP